MPDDKRLDHLMTYTTFHIGVYVSLVTALIGAGIFGSLDHPVLRFATGCFLFAGICGGVIGSNIPDHADFNSFAAAHIGFWSFKICSYRVWAALEHLAFWAGILPLTAMFLCQGSDAFKTPSG